VLRRNKVGGRKRLSSVRRIDLAASPREFAPRSDKGTAVDTEATAVEDGAPRPIGAILAAARAASGLELSDIARDTRVPLRHLAAIEADDHDHLPALPYAIGFVKAFARAVGVDPEMAGAHFRAETSKVAHVPAPPAMTPLDERRLPPRGVVSASIAALVAIVAGIVAWSAGAFDPSPPAPAVATTATAPVTVATTETAGGTADPNAVPPATSAAPAGDGNVPPAATAAVSANPLPTAVPPATATPATAAPVTAAAATGAAPGTVTPHAASTVAPAAPTAATGNVVITASEDAWFKVSVYDPAVAKVVTVKTGVLAKGERYVPPPTPGLRLWTGRAGALTITVDGRPIPPLGGPVETVKNVSLDASDLRARLASHTVPAPGRAGPPVG
jgi:cytoskeletal protein RodZ